MDKIYQRAEDKNVASRIIYVGEIHGTSGNTWSYAYKDKDGTIKMTHDELMNACLKGALIYENDSYSIITRVLEIEVNTDVRYTVADVYRSGADGIFKVYSSEYTGS